MKWIINPTLVNKMRGTKFTILQFSVGYFHELFGHVPNVYQMTESLRLFTSHIVNPTLILRKCVLISMSAIDPEEIPFVYIRISYKSDSDDVGTSITPDNGLVTMVTFESLDSDIIKAYMLFIQQEDDKPDMPDTRIIGLIQSKITYSFNVSELIVGHPYRIRFLDDIEIFDKKYKVHDEIYAVLASADEDSLKFATAYSNICHDEKNTYVSGAFELKPDMKFELDKLV